jgi:hypothetical protein
LKRASASVTVWRCCVVIFAVLAAAERRIAETLRAQLQTAMALAKRGPLEG